MTFAIKLEKLASLVSIGTDTALDLLYDLHCQLTQLLSRISFLNRLSSSFWQVEVELKQLVDCATGLILQNVKEST